MGDESLEPSLENLRTGRHRLGKKLCAVEASGPSRQKILEQVYGTANERTVVTINCAEISELFTPYSSGTQLELQPELIDYIDRQVYPIPAHRPLTLQFLEWRQSEGEKDQAEQCLHTHYLLALHDKRLDLRVNFWKSLLLFCFGAGMLLLSFSLSAWIDNRLFSEVLSVIATFSLWETAGFVLLERRQLKEDWLNAGQLVLAEIEFCEIQE